MCGRRSLQLAGPMVKIMQYILTYLDECERVRVLPPVEAENEAEAIATLERVGIVCGWVPVGVVTNFSA